jgi:uncharacterized membrane protein
MGYHKLDQLENWLSVGSRRQITFWIIVGLAMSLYLAQVICNHYFFRTYAFDYALYSNAAWDYSHLRINANPIFTPPLKTFMQDHIAFTLYLILPIYWILSPLFGTYTLLIIEVLFIVLGGIGCYKFIYLISKNSFISLLALLHYFMLHGHFAALAEDYHDVVVGASMITWYVYFFARKKYLAATLVFLFVALSKENMPLWLAFVTLVLMYYRKTDRKAVLYTGSLFVVSIAYFLTCFFILIPYFEDPARPHWAFYYKAFGDSPGDVFVYFITHPFETFSKLFYNHNDHPFGDWVKLEYYIYFILSGGWLLFRRPVLLISILPVLAQKMLMDSAWRWSLSGYAAIEITSILSLAIFFVIWKTRQEKSRQFIAIAVTLVSIVATVHAFGNRHTQWHESRKENVFSLRMYSGHVDVKPVYEGLKLIPGDAVVCATNKIAPHLAHRSGIYVFPEIRDAEYLALLNDGDPFPISQEKFLELRKSLIESDDWEVIFRKGQMVVLKRKSIRNSGP